MFNTRRFSNTEHANAVSLSHRIFATVIISSAIVMTLSGCGQKGALYLAEPSSQTAQSRSAGVLESTSHPQDAAFAGIDDDGYQKTRYLEQQYVLPEPSDDPNDY